MYHKLLHNAATTAYIRNTTHKWEICTVSDNNNNNEIQSNNHSKLLLMHFL